MADFTDAPVHGETGKQNISQRQGQASVSKARVANSIPFSIDLSGGSDLRPSSSSTDEVFGESRQLWREDSATRKEPILKRGRKRKCEEFELESKLSQSSFTAVENYPDEILPTQRQNKSSQHTSHNSQKEHSSQRLPDMKPIAQEGLRSKLDAPNKKPRNSKSHKQFSPIKTVPTPDPRLKEQEFEDEEQCPTNKKSSSGSRRGNTIADSEDEDEELESQAFYRESRTDASLIGKLENVNAAYPTIPAGIEKSTQKRSPAKVKNNPGVPMSSIKLDDNREKSYSTKTSNDASPFQRDSPTKLPSAHLEHICTINSSTDGAKTTLAETERASLEKFVGLQLDDLQEYRKQLHHGLRSAAKEICDCIDAGGGGTPEMHQRSTSFSLKINAVDTLLELKGHYNQIRMQNQLLKERVYSTLIEKQNISQDDIQKINSVANRLLQTELRILKLLIQAAIPFDDLVSCHRSKTVDPKDDSGGQSTLQVRSTQLPSDCSNTRIHASTVLDSTSSIGQAVHQAHAPDLNPRSPKKLPAMSYSHIQRSPLQTYTSLPRSKDVSANFSPSKRKPRQENCVPSLNSRSDRNVGTGKSFADAQSSCSKMPIPNYDDDDEEEEEEEEYTLNMGSPFRMMSREDDYGHEDDDEMLEAAEEFESRGIKSCSTFETTERLIFAETSPNIVRPEPKKPRSALLNPPTQASHMQHVWSRDLKAAMKERFHLRGFRPNQLEAINATLSGKDTFVLMPTGGGKSLCYQLPAIIRSGKTRGVTVVISPLLSLMQDQVDHLQKLKIQAFLTNGEVSAEHRRFIIESLRDPSVEKYIQLLYITPEMISKNQVMVGILRDLYKKKKLARIVIDEAHCVSQWGHDFRPDYKLLGDVREQFQGVPVMALTATATENVKVDVIHNLRIQNCEVLTQSFNRPNLTYDVRSKGKGVEVQENIATTIKTQYKDQSGIIYCLSRQSCEKLAKTLREVYHIKAQHYHAGMDPAAKSQVQKGWQAGEHNVIVATIAFGMGIDKPDVRFVIHHTIPKSLEGYYQETGRAGRDGKRSGCYLYYGYQDTAALKRMIDAGEGSWEQKERQRQMLRNVIGFCENRSDCRRVQVLNYFNESFKREDCEGGCDNCNEKCTFESRDFTEFAAAAIALVRRVEHQQVTLLHCVDVFRGVKGKKITQLGHCDLDQYGTGSNLERGDIERLFYRLLSEDALSEESIVNKAGFPSKYLHVSGGECLFECDESNTKSTQLGPNHNDFTRGVRKLKIQIRVSPNSKIPKIKKPIKNKGTGVAASRHEYPLSTNVSSPIQAASRRRIAQNKSDMNPHSNGYSRDDFVVSDDEESDGFEPVRKAGKPRITRKRQLGPPITTDQKLEKLNSIHRLVVDDFVGQAKEESARVSHPW